MTMQCRDGFTRIYFKDGTTGLAPLEDYDDLLRQYVVGAGEFFTWGTFYDPEESICTARMVDVARVGRITAACIANEEADDEAERELKTSRELLNGGD